MLVLTISEVVPIAMGLNWDLIWFGIIVVVVLETGMIRPPLISLFIVESIALGFRWVRFFCGICPFWFPMALMLVLLVFFPDLHFSCRKQLSVAEE